MVARCAASAGAGIWIWIAVQSALQPLPSCRASSISEARIFRRLLLLLSGLSGLCPQGPASRSLSVWQWSAAFDALRPQEWRPQCRPSSGWWRALLSCRRCSLACMDYCSAARVFCLKTSYVLPVGSPKHVRTVTTAHERARSEGLHIC